MGNPKKFSSQKGVAFSLNAIDLLRSDLESQSSPRNNEDGGTLKIESFPRCLAGNYQMYSSGIQSLFDAILIPWTPTDPPQLSDLLCNVPQQSANANRAR